MTSSPRTSRMEPTMSKHVMFCILLAACSTRTETAVDVPREPPEAIQPAAPAPVAATLSEAGNCVGHTCTLHFVAHARGNTSTFTKKRCRDATCPVRSGELTAAARSEVRKLGSQLAELTLEPVYGSPGSADGPVYVALVHRADGTESKHLIDPMEPDLLPPQLREASNLIEAVSDALGRCESTTLIQVGTECAEAERRDGEHAIGRP
jgi:hypothetical protein